MNQLPDIHQSGSNLDLKTAPATQNLSWQLLTRWKVVNQLTEREQRKLRDRGGIDCRKQLPFREPRGQGAEVGKIKTFQELRRRSRWSWNTDLGWVACCLAGTGNTWWVFRLGSNFYLGLSWVCRFTPLTKQFNSFPPRAHTGSAAGPGRGQADLPPGLLTQQVQGRVESWRQARMQPPRGDSAQTFRVWEQILLSSVDNCSFEKPLVTGPS